MEPVTRRSFLVTSSAGALGVAGAAALASPLAAGATDDAPEPTPAEIAALDDPAVLAIRDPRAGVVELMVSDRSIVFTDKNLVARVLRASR
jgi:hypothetical protein